VQVKACCNNHRVKPLSVSIYYNAQTVLWAHRAVQASQVLPLVYLLYVHVTHSNRYKCCLSNIKAALMLLILDQPLQHQWTGG